MIRPMTEADVSEVAELEQNTFTTPWSEQSLRESLGKVDYLFLVCEEQGTIVGYGGLLRVGDEADLLDIAVAEGDRGRGIGTAIVAELLRRGRALGIRAFTLEVRVSNCEALHVYEKLGFTREGLRKEFYEKPREDAAILWLRTD
ncbi:MAG: ribosomal protein S18-alanine N-acetyltransferase [Lachnospiraceae bacterium]|nr:ribosomal protein S18-alanine N-acetyltransferase [Lachnospiraceae bacterium]